MYDVNLSFPGQEFSFHCFSLLASGKLTLMAFSLRLWRYPLLYVYMLYDRIIQCAYMFFCQILQIAVYEIVLPVPGSHILALCFQFTSPAVFITPTLFPLPPRTQLQPCSPLFHLLFSSTSNTFSSQQIFSVDELTIITNLQPLFTSFSATPTSIHSQNARPLLRRHPCYRWSDARGGQYTTNPKGW